MQLPAFRERLSRLPRLLKILLPVLFILILVIIAESGFYFWTLREKAEELKYVNTETTNQEGVYLYYEGTDDPIAIRGWVTKIDGWVLTVENEGEEIQVNISRDSKFAVITEDPSLKNDDLKGEKEEVFGYHIPMGASESYLEDNLDESINIGDFVVISMLDRDETRMLTGKAVSILKLLSK